MAGFELLKTLKLRFGISFGNDRFSVGIVVARLPQPRDRIQLTPLPAAASPDRQDRFFVLRLFSPSSSIHSLSFHLPAVPVSTATSSEQWKCAEDSVRGEYSHQGTFLRPCVVSKTVRWEDRGSSH